MPWRWASGFQYFEEGEASSPSRSISPRRFVGWVQRRLLYPEDDRNTILRNVVNYSSSGMTSDRRTIYSHEWILISPSAPLREKYSPHWLQTHNKINRAIRRHFGKQMNNETILRIHNITAKTALKFGSEAWVLKKREEQSLEAAQMKFLRNWE